VVVATNGANQSRSLWWYEILLVVGAPMAAWYTLALYGDYTTLGAVLLVIAGIWFAYRRSIPLHYRRWPTIGIGLILFWVVCNPLHSLYVALQ